MSTQDYPSENIFDFAKMDGEELLANSEALDLRRPEAKKGATKRPGSEAEKKVPKKSMKKADDEEGEAYNMVKENEGPGHVENDDDYSEKEKCVCRCYSNDYSFRVMTKRNYTFMRMARLYTTKKGENRTFTIDLPVKDFENLFSGIPHLRKNRLYQKSLLSSQ